MNKEEMKIRGTTILALRRKGEAVVGGDGQVTMNEMVVKSGAKKIRKLYKGKVLVGFAGSAADALTLFDRFESKLEEYKGQLPRAAIELAKEHDDDDLWAQMGDYRVTDCDAEHIVECERCNDTGVISDGVSYDGEKPCIDCQ